jgi:hypothetical protein
VWVLCGAFLSQGQCSVLPRGQQSVLGQVESTEPWVQPTPLLGCVAGAAPLVWVQGPC